MNHHAKRLTKDLETLGFRWDPEAKTSGRGYRHQNAPDKLITVHDHMSDTSITAAIRLANRIADTGWSGPAMPQKIRERARIKSRADKAQREAEKAEARRRADAAGVKLDSDRKALADRDHARNVLDLMQPKWGK